MRLSASGLDLAAHCLWSFRPEVIPPVCNGNENIEASLGTATHAVAEVESAINDQDLDARWRLVVLGESEAKAGEGLDDKGKTSLATLAAVWRRWWLNVSTSLEWRAQEVPYALDPIAGSARVLPSSGHRDYSAALPHEIPGTADLVGIGADGVLRVFDYKTGQGPHNIDTHWRQMAHLATSVGRAYGAHLVRAVVVWITPDGVKISAHDFDAWDMTKTLVEIAARAEQIPAATAKPGLHCDDLWCKARAICPETRALLLTAGMSLDGKHRLPIVGKPQNDEQAYHKLLANKALEAWLKQSEADVKEYSKERPIPSPEGKLYGPKDVETERPMLTVTGAEEALINLGLGAAIDREISVSWESIGEALKARQEAGEEISIEDEKERAREALRELGALKVSKFPQYRWRKAPKEKRA